MFLNYIVFFLLVCVFRLNNCVEDEWKLYENKFKHHNREEIFIANVTTDPNFELNFTVEKWKTLSTGIACYNGGISNKTVLVVLVSTVPGYGLGITTKVKALDLKDHIADVEFFRQKKQGAEKIFAVVYVPEKEELAWYSIDDGSKKITSWPTEGLVLHYSFFKSDNRNFLLTSVANNSGTNSMIIYGFDAGTLERWYYQSISLPVPSPSSCVSFIETEIYLSIVQPDTNQLLIYRFIDKHFIRFDNLTSPEINQVVCFEIGFKSFIAFNGLKAGIYEFTTNSLRKREVVNANLEEIDFLLPIPVNTYRDETILLVQRKLDHDSHFSFDVEVITYNGNKFEEHVDIQCSLFEEKQNGLKCMMDYDPHSGILGSSYIAVLDRLALLVPKSKGVTTLFNMDVGIRKLDHPAKKELEQFVERKKLLQVLIDEHKSTISQLATKRHGPIELNLSKAAPRMKEARAFVGKESNNAANENLSELKDKVEEVIKEIAELEELSKKIKPFMKGKKYKSITFNNRVQIEGHLVTDSVETEDKELSEELSDIVRKDKLLPIQEAKIFNKLNAEEVDFNVVNGIPKNEFITRNGESVEAIGNLIFENLIEVENVNITTGIVNDVNIEKWINVNDSIAGPLTIQNLVVRNNSAINILNNHNLTNDLNKTSQVWKDFHSQEKMYIHGNVTVQTLNGHDFESFLRKLCAIHVKCHIPNLRLFGTLNIEGNAEVRYLNNLKFPEEYVELDPKKTLVITGAKKFTNITRAYNIITNNTINNVDLSKVVTLTDEQHINGTLIFDHLELESNLKVDGKVKGEQIEKLLENIGLKETHNIQANVEFRNLEVLGDIIIKDKFNGTSLNEYFDTFVLKDENATITGNKNFPKGFTVLENLQIESNSINNISLDSIVTKNTNQDLNINTIAGNIIFDNLYINGLFDGQNVTELNETLIKLNANQTIDSELIFLDDLFTNTLIVDQVVDTIVNNTAETEDFYWDFLNLENLVVERNIVGDIDIINSNNVSENYLTYTQDQTIFEPYFITKMTCKKMDIRRINNRDFPDIFSYQDIRKNISDILLYRNATIETINVEGNINIGHVKNEDIGKIFKDHAWMKLHRNSSRFVINGNVYFKSLEIEQLANANFDEYNKILIFKNESYVEVEGSIIFENGMKVEKLIETSTLNNIALQYILRKSANQTLLGPITILGNVTIDDNVTVKEMINNVEVTYMLNNFDIGEESLKVKGEIMFQRISYIRNLTINGSINGESFNDLKNRLIYKNSDIYLDKDIIFNQTVHIHGNLGISKDTNGIDLSKFIPRIVWLTQDASIEGPIKFSSDVDGLQSLNVETGINAKLFFGSNFEDNIRKGVLINEGLIAGTFHFKNLTVNENLKTQFINGLSMDTIIPLKSDQLINELNLGEITVTHNFNVGNQVNGVNLRVEKNRTMLRNEEQSCLSEVVFENNVLIEDNLKTAKLNGKLASKIVTTNTDQNLTAIYNFNSKSYIDGHLIVNGLVNDVNLTSWKNKSVHLHDPLHVKGKWMVVENLNLYRAQSGDGVMNDIYNNITNLIKDIKDKEVYLCGMEKRIAEDFYHMCKDMTYIYNSTKNQIHKFEYFEEDHQLWLQNPINYVKYFEYEKKSFLLVNEKNSCFSIIMAFDGKRFLKMNTVHTGGISQVEVARDKSNLFLISRGLDDDDLICNIRFSTVVWKWTGEEMEALATTKSQELLQASQQPLTFYGLNRGVVTEFKIVTSNVMVLQEYRKWNITEDNAAFIPKGLKTGPLLRTGEYSIFLKKNDPIIDEEYGSETEAILVGNFKKQPNTLIPGRNGGDLSIVNVGVKGTRKTLLAVAKHKKSQVQRHMDMIEIYIDPFKGELFDQILTYRPAGLTSVEFGNGETLLVFIEDKKVLKIHEYKGIEGFKHRSTIQIQADQLFLMDLPSGNKIRKTKVLGLVYNNKITFLRAIMVGSKIKNNLQCSN